MRISLKDCKHVTKFLRVECQLLSLTGYVLARIRNTRKDEYPEENARQAINGLVRCIRSQHQNTRLARRLRKARNR